VWMAKFFHIFQKKPYILEDKCIGCGICVDSCPVEGKALKFIGKKAPVYNYRKCIRCFCCQEMCPKKAIQVK
ncbi:MAG: 4Fe-4S dicluster domain-containing protein, partial [Blautia hydrogenotrophica]